MIRRGIRLDTSGHASLITDLTARRDELAEAYIAECERAARPDLRDAGVPSSSPAIEQLLNTVLSERHYRDWRRTEKVGRLGTKRSDLLTVANDYPLLGLLIEINSIDKLLRTFGAGLTAYVNPTTGRHPRQLQGGFRVHRPGGMRTPEHATDPEEAADCRTEELP